MVAQTAQIARPLVTPPAAFVEGRWRVHPFTRTDAEALVRLGMIPEDASTELLNGMVVLTDRSSLEQDPTMIGQAHRLCVEKLSGLRGRVDSTVRHVETQQPLVCTETHVPQPDFMVLRGVLADYSDLPKAADAWCVVEVADSSYERDLGIKLRGYALAGVGQYVIINLRNRTAEVYASPDPAAGSYAAPRVIEQSGTLSLRVGENESFDVALRDLLP